MIKFGVGLLVYSLLLNGCISILNDAIINTSQVNNSDFNSTLLANNNNNNSLQIDINSTSILNFTNSSYFNISNSLDSFIINSNHNEFNLNDTYAEINFNCSNTEFVCFMKDKYNCLSNNYLCDGVIHCENGTDEVNCTHICGNDFKCLTGSIKCIPINDYCDGMWDCEDGSDEKQCFVNSCPKGKYVCMDKSKCLEPYQICDKTYDCDDHSDELECITQSSCEASHNFFCDKSVCIPYALKCDGYKDCTDGTDESNCTCLQHEFQCENGDCINKSAHCNGIIDCKDGSDEWECVRTDENNTLFMYNPTVDDWSPVCGTEQFKKSKADLICNQLGYTRATNAYFLSLKSDSVKYWISFENDTAKAVTSCNSRSLIKIECSKINCTLSYDPIEVRSKTDNPKEINSMVKIKDNKDNSCLGQIISPLWILSSVSCMINLKYSDQVKIFRNNTDEIGQVTQIILHPHASKFRLRYMFDFDVALVKLKNPLLLKANQMEAICLPPENIEYGITCFVPVENEKEAIATKIEEISECNSEKHYNGILAKRHICASPTKRLAKIPIGSPLICLSATSEWSIAGLLSFYSNKTNYAHPSIFSNAYSLKNFINKVVGFSFYNTKFQENSNFDEDNTNTRSLNKIDIVDILDFKEVLNDTEQLKTSSFNISLPSFEFLNNTNAKISLTNETISNLMNSFPLNLNKSNDNSTTGNSTNNTIEILNVSTHNISLENDIKETEKMEELYPNVITSNFTFTEISVLPSNDVSNFTSAKVNLYNSK